jgi:hypothetical protein
MEVVRQEQGVDDIAQAEIRLAPLQLPSGKRTAVVQVLFPDLGYSVSLPSSARFRALSTTSSHRTVLEISLLDRARICSDNSVVLGNGTRLRAVELLPTYLPYNPSELEERILLHVISLTKSGGYCYRSIREGLPEHLQDRVPDLRMLDYSRVHTIKAPPLKVIRGYIADNDPNLKLSDQKIADALARFGVRVPRPRPRAASHRVTT